MFAQRGGIGYRFVVRLELEYARALGAFMGGDDARWEIRLGALGRLTARRSGDVVTVTMLEHRTVRRSYWVDLQVDHQRAAARFLSAV